MKNHPNILLSLAVLALAAAPVLRAEDPPATPPADQPAGHHARRDELREHYQRMVKDLNLTSDQQAKAEAILKQTGDELRALRADTTLTPDQRHAKAKDLRRGAEEQIHALLTPDQQAKAKALREQHRQQGEQPPAPPST